MFAWLKNWIKRRHEAAMFESAVHIVNDGSITSTYPDGKAETVEWNALERIEIHTNDRGPWDTDVWWILTDANGQCSYPQGATGDSSMLSEYQKLEGFNDNEVIRAMGCTSNKVFICWSKQGAT